MWVFWAIFYQCLCKVVILKQNKVWGWNGENQRSQISGCRVTKVGGKQQCEKNYKWGLTLRIMGAGERRVDVPSERWQLSTQVMHTVVTMGVKTPLLPYLSFFSVDVTMWQFRMLTTTLQKKKKSVSSQFAIFGFSSLKIGAEFLRARSNWELILKVEVRSGCHSASRKPS